MWITDVEFDGHTLTGNLLNTSESLPELVSGAQVSVPLERMDDWLYYSMGLVCGGFTIQAMRAQMPLNERQSHDAAWGLPFPDPELCNITAYALKAEEAPHGLSRLWKKAPPPPGMPYAEALAHSRANEHPMSQSTADIFVQSYSANPSLITDTDENGWTVLHQDALSGNLAQVEAALAAGADPTATTPDGRTPLDLALSMNWTRVVEALSRTAN